MAPARAQAQGKTIVAMPCCMLSLLLAIVTVVTVNAAVLVKAHDSLKSLPSPLVLYILLPSDRTVVVASPMGSNSSGSDFGTISVFNTIARESPAEDSAVLGQSIGQRILAKDGSMYTEFSYMLNVFGYAGIITATGVQDSLGNGNYAITGGTGDFLSATGQIKIDAITPHVLLRSMVYINFGCK